MKHAQRGRFITVEGGEGTGKSTLIQGLREALPPETLFTREPGGSEGAEEIRALLVTGEAGRWDATAETLLLNAGRRDHVIRVIEPAMRKGCDVICDRFVDSTRLTFVLDAPAQIGLERASARGGAERFESMGLEFHAAVREAFLDIAASEPKRCSVIDARMTEQEVLSEAISPIWPLTRCSRVARRLARQKMTRPIQGWPLETSRASSLSSAPSMKKPASCAPRFPWSRCAHCGVTSHCRRIGGIGAA